jgi:hypothetical protein
MKMAVFWVVAPSKILSRNISDFHSAHINNLRAFSSGSGAV